MARTHKFEDTLMKVHAKIRKPPMNSNKTILSNKDKERKKDIKKGRKNWTDYEK